MNIFIRIVGVVGVTCCALGQSVARPVQVFGVPSNVGRVELLADTDSLRFGVIALAQASSSGYSAALPLLPSGEAVRIRAIAYSGTSDFPTVTAIGTAVGQADQTEPIPVALSWIKPVIEEVPSPPDGSVSLLAKFGSAAFFRPGAVAELWVSPHRPVRNCSGSHFIAPLYNRDGSWDASFKIPVAMASYGAFFQLVYHALDFQQADQIPILVWPNVDLSESPLVVTAAEGTKPLPGGRR